MIFSAHQTANHPMRPNTTRRTHIDQITAPRIRKAAHSYMNTIKSNMRHDFGAKPSVEL
jgi:hypothetical protein